MAKNKLHYCLCTGIMICSGFMSCTDYLEKAPNYTLNDETVFENFYNAEKFHTGIYSTLTDRFTPLGSYVGVPAACASDEADVYSTSMGADAGKLTSGDYDGVDANISTYYTGIRRANTFLQKVPVIPFPNENIKNRMLGETYFLRAFYYTELIKRFGGMPILDETNILGPNDDFYLPRNSYKECVLFILEDLKKAISYLPVTLDETQYGRATKGAAMALKARVLLFAASPQWQREMGEDLWADAAQAALDVINLTNEQGNKVYALYNTGKGADDYANLFFKRWEHGNREIIFAKHAAPVGFTSAQIQNWAPKGGNLGGYGAVAPTQNFVDLFEMANGKPITDPTSGYKEDDPYSGRDPRFYKIILYNGATWQGETIETFYNENRSQSGAHRQDKTNYTRTGYYVRKYLPEDVRYETTTKSYHEWIFFRLAEMYLNYAEALNETLASPSQQVYDAVNTVRNRSGVIDLPEGLSKEEMRARIKNERAIELCFEEHRWWDMRRWGDAVQAFGGPMYEMEITKNADGTFNYKKKVYINRIYRSYMDLYPIPLSEIRKNSLLKQNPGW